MKIEGFGGRMGQLTGRAGGTQTRELSGEANRIAIANGAALRSGYIDSPEKRATQLRLFLQGLGAPYSCFALYLASRIDLLPPEYCREFARTPDDAAPMTAAEVLQCLNDEFGDRLGATLPHVNLTPLFSTLIAQYHSAETGSAMPVTVAILRPEFHQLHTRKRVTQLLDRKLLQEHCSELVTGDILADFRSSMSRRLDLKSQAEKLDLVLRDSTAFEGLAADRIFSELSSERVLLLSRSPATGLDQAHESRLFTPERLAILLCKVWFQQALFGRCFPVDPQYRHITVSSSDRIAFPSAELVTLPRLTQENLWNYLLATTTDDPDRAAGYLLREMSHNAQEAVDYESFRSSFRQSAYFGALQPILGTDSNAFAQLVFQHWKTALAHGYVPKAPLLSFYRGLFSIAKIARQIFPSGDPVRYAVDELRTARVVEQVQDFFDVRFVARNVDKLLVAAAHLPRAIDEVLTRASEPTDKEAQNSMSGGRDQHGSSHRTTTLLAFSLLVTAVLVAQSTAMPSWMPRSAIAMLMLIGLLVLSGLKE